MALTLSSGALEHIHVYNPLTYAGAAAHQGEEHGSHQFRHHGPPELRGLDVVHTRRHAATLPRPPRFTHCKTGQITKRSITSRQSGQKGHSQQDSRVMKRSTTARQSYQEKVLHCKTGHKRLITAKQVTKRHPPQLLQNIQVKKVNHCKTFRSKRSTSAKQFGQDKVNHDTTARSQEGHPPQPLLDSSGCKEPRVENETGHKGRNRPG